MPPPIAGTLLKSARHRPPPPTIFAKTPNPSTTSLPTPSFHRTTTNIRKTTINGFLTKVAGERCKNQWLRSPDLFPGSPRPRGYASAQSDVMGSVQSDGGGEKKDEREGMLTVPTMLTLGRVAAVPLIVSTFYMNGWWATTATTSIFVAAAITDWLDGYIARKMKLRTSFGAFLDPVADKLMVATTLVLLCSRPLDVAVFGAVPWLLTVPSFVIIGREITMSAVREWAASQNTRVLEAVAVSNLGKWKTATQMTALTILLACRDPSLPGSNVLVPSGLVLLYISSGLAIWSLVVYMRNIWRLLLK